MRLECGECLYIANEEKFLTHVMEPHPHIEHQLDEVEVWVCPECGAKSYDYKGYGEPIGFHDECDEIPESELEDFLENKDLSESGGYTVLSDEEYRKKYLS